MIDKVVDEFLARIGAMEQAHSGRTLANHLRGTYQILRDWELDDSTCLAGLFHSIYGTNAFRHASLQLQSRYVLRDLIGERAEHLAYLFHATSRPWAWIDAMYSGGVVSRLDGQFLALDDATLAQLIEIDCANLLEQRGGGRFLSELVDELEIVPIPVAQQVIETIIQSCRQEQPEDG